MSAVLLFGATGQLGARLASSLTEAGYEVTALDRAACDFAVADARKIDLTLRAVAPDFIINAAAYTAVDKAETERDLAHRINADLPGIVARAARAAHLPFLHFSTDYVFDGIRGRYTEDSPTHPVNVYGETKLAGEQAALAEGAHVFRLQWIYDNRGKNFFLTIKRLLGERAELRMVADQVGAPSSARDLALAITAAIPKICSGEIPPGVYHLAAGGYTSWHGFACAIAEAPLGSRNRILPITTAEYPLPAARPLDGRLNCTRLTSHGIALPHWRYGLDALLRENV